MTTTIKTAALTVPAHVVVWIDEHGGREYPGSEEDATYLTHEDAEEAIESLRETDPDVWADADLRIEERETPIVVTDVTASTNVDDEGAVDATVTICGITAGVTLVPAHAGHRNRDQWVTWGSLDEWLSTSGHDLPTEVIAEIPHAVTAAAHALGMSAVQG